LNGAQLAPVAHRNKWQDRTAEKQFHPRVEGSFQRIIRRGDNPTNYWWEVTDKSGTVYSYGGTESNGIDTTSILRDDADNIAYWALVEVRDLNDNFVRYHCSIQDDLGLAGGTVMGRNIYVDRITYTGHGTEEGKYEVLFTRDRALGETKRTDVGISGVYGFKKVTADLLRKIEVNYNGDPVRSYELTYVEGAFYKTLLEKITEFDAAGNQFTQHQFDYFDDVKASEGYVPFLEEESWTPQNDEVKGKFVNPIELFNDDASALSGTKSNNNGFGLAVTFGVNDGELNCKSNSIGGDFGFSKSDSDGILSLIDIDGDGLSDKVFMNKNGFSYRPNQSGPNGTTIFGDTLPITGINKFYKEKSTTTSSGFQGQAGTCKDFSAFIGFNSSRSKSQTTVYFTDVNGDQLIDVAVDGQVFFNHIDDGGSPVFTPSSADTPSPISKNEVIDGNIFTIDEMEMEDAIDANPLHDVVRVWEAPFEGIINIDAPAILIQPTEPSGTADGVRLTIQKNSEENLLMNLLIEADNYDINTPEITSDIPVQKGDRIYFRVQSVDDGTDDLVDWNPTITYNKHEDDLLDANNLPIYQFSAQQDFLISAAQTIEMPIDGTIKIEGSYVKPITSDNVLAQIINVSDGTVVWTNNAEWDEPVTEDIDITLAVTAGDSYSFTVNAGTNIDWTAIKWSPKLSYIESADPSLETDNLFDVNGNPVLNFYPTVDFSFYAATIQKTNFYEATENVALSIEPLVTFTNAPPSGKLIFSIKKANELVAKQPVAVGAGVVIGTTTTMIMLEEGDRLFMDFYASSIELAESIVETSVSITVNGMTQIIDAGLFAKNDEMIFGPQYRGWGQFAYNGNRNRVDEIIDEAELKLKDYGDPINFDGIDLDSLVNAGGFKTGDEIFIMMMPDNEKQRWQGYDDLTYIEAFTMSSSRMGEDDLNAVSPIPQMTGTIGDSGAMAITKITKSTSESFSVGGGVPIGDFGANGSYSKTTGDTKVCSDFIDMNGDRYPDIVTDTHIQYTNATGGLLREAISHGFGVNNLSNNESDGVTLGGSYASADSKGTIYNVKNRSLEVGKGAGGGLSGNFAKGKNDIDYSWQDVNGDGLPDRVYEGGNVALNLGYKFTEPEPWGYDEIQEGKSISYGAGLGVNIGSGSIAAGISLSRSESEGEKKLQDINGDGLLDELILGDMVQVRINTGNGFGPQIPWQGANALSESSSTSESANIAFTVCLALPIVPPAKLCFNPSTNLGQGVSRELTQIRDINGDGYPDFLRSSKDNNLTVKKSTIGKTNLLKSVKRPLGATFAVDYKRVGNTYEQPNDVWTLSSVLLHDGFEGDGADEMLTTFEYEKGYYDRHERDFYGFKKVKTNHNDTEMDDVLYRSVVQEFSNDNYYENGLLTRTILQDANGSFFTEDTMQYELKDVNTGANLPGDYSEDDGCAFPAMVYTEKRFYEGMEQIGKLTIMTYEYDKYGNIKKYTDFGELNDGGADDYITEITYHEVLENYILNAPDTLLVKDANNNTYRYRSASIDRNNGNVTEMKMFLDEEESSNYNMAYDTYGNISKLERPWNYKGERLTFEYAYDDAVQTYNTSVRDSYGYSSSATYDYSFGQMLTTTDLNGNEMKYTIDDVGRIETITGPFELAEGLPYTIAFEYYPNHNPVDTCENASEFSYALTKHYDPQHPNNNIETYTFIDGLKRPLQVKKDGAIFTEPWESALKQILPDDATTTYLYDFANDRNSDVQFRTRVTDPENHWKDSYTNVRGLTTSTLEDHDQDDAAPETQIWTSFAFNPINELKEVWDDDQNIITSTYDWLGRRTSVDHPDAGRSEFEYDLASNLTKKMTAKLLEKEEAIDYEYFFERLTNINYPFNTYNDVRYTYGETGDDYNRAGRIILQEDATGMQEFWYDELGNITKNERTINVPDCEALAFTTEYTYDTWNRLTEMIYPDKEELTYKYNTGGLLNRLDGIKRGTDYCYVKQLGYDKFEQRVYLHYGNGTETRYTYEPERRRLDTMQVENTKHRRFIDYNYDYDKVSNIKRFENLATVERESHLLGGNTNYKYNYDDVYRLIEANGYHQGSKGIDTFNLQMTYNNLHSIVKKNQHHERKINTASVFVDRKKTTYDLDYKYTSDQPHAATEVGDKLYSYDKNGNQTGWEEKAGNANTKEYRLILWDEDNRLAAINDNGAVFKYLYEYRH